MLTVVTGPPCAGKTTYVLEHREPGDLVVDLDAIAHALGYPERQIVWDDQHPAVTAARLARSTIVDAITKRQIDGDAWLIDSEPHPISLKIYQRMGAQIMTLNPGAETCHQRARDAGRHDSVHAQIDRWHTGRTTGLSVFD